MRYGPCTRLDEEQGLQPSMGGQMDMESSDLEYASLLIDRYK